MNGHVEPSFESLIIVLQQSWSAETAFDASDWSPENPARGQCVVSALVMQDYMGGDLQRFEVRGDDFAETHYTNLLNSVVIDTTASQYNDLNVSLTPRPTNLKGFASVREKRLADDATRRRYELLSERVASILRK
jgi:hypothetical protein